MGRLHTVSFVLFLDPEDELALQVNVVVAFMPATHSSIPGAGKPRQRVQKEAINAQAQQVDSA